MIIVKGIMAGKVSYRNSKKKPLTDKVHAMRGELVASKHTVCGIDIWNSTVLGVPHQGDVSEVNCKRCLAKLAKEAK